jgi:hypothetical protein
MGRRKPVAPLLVVLILLASSSVASQLDEMTTEELRLLYFDATQGYLAPHVARCFLNSLELHRELWPWEPSQPITVLLVDLSDRGNAAAGAVPRNMLMLEIAPLSFVYEIVSANERMNWLINHELVHIAAVDGAAGRDHFWRKFFAGKVQPSPDNPGTILFAFLTTPREAAPRWYQEGIAVFVETWMAGGVGRAQGAWDEMVFRSMVRDGSHFYSPLGLVSEGTNIDFQVEVNSYLYGTRFMSYLAFEYGPEKVIEWVARRDGSKAYFANQFRHVFGTPLKQAWADWVAWEHEFQRANLEAIRQYPITPHTDLSDQALGSVSRAFFDPDRNAIFAAFNYPGVVAHLGSISVADGEVDKIRDIKGPVIYTVTSTAYDPESGKIFFTTDNLAHRDLWLVDPESGKSEMLLKDARIGDLVLNPADRSLWGVRHFNGFATLVRVPRPYDRWEQVRTWPYGEVLYDLDISPDGALLSASVGGIDGNHTLNVWQTAALAAGESEPVRRHTFGVTIPSNFVFSPDGRYLYGSTYYTGASNIFRYELETGDIEAVSNTETGFFRPIPLGDDKLIVFRYTGEGFVPATIEAEPLEDIAAIEFLGSKIVDKHPIVKDWMVGSPAEIDLDERGIEKGAYHGFRTIGIESIYPIVQGYRGSPAIGFRLNLSDPLLLNRIFLTASYNLDGGLDSDERIHARIEYRRYNWTAALWYNRADFYDLFGPTYRGLKGYAAELGWNKSLIYDEPRELDLSLDTAFYGGLEQVPGYQNVQSPYDTLWWTQAKLRYSNVRSSLGFVDHEKGHTWELAAVNNYVNSQSIPLIRGAFDIGFALPIRHSSIWLRTDAGYAHGDADNPFASFYFGGFGNNYVDDGPIQRFRSWYAFPGVELNSIAGQTFTKAMLEWNLPPVRFRRVGWPGFYLQWIRPSVFTTGIVTSFDDSSQRREVGNVGFQLDLHVGVLSRLDMTLSVGFAQAFEQGMRASNEFMISLKIL